jgi:hypothetical protein
LTFFANPSTEAGRVGFVSPTILLPMQHIAEQTGGFVV